MKTPLYTLAILYGLGSTLVGGAPPAHADEAPSARTLVANYCVSCHGEKKPKGDLRLDRLAQEGWSDYDLLDAVASRIEAGEMPPRSAPKALTPEHRSQLLALLKKRLETLDESRLAGQYRKLTAREYSHTLEDIFGVGIDKLSDLPFDAEHDLKKLSEHQVITSFAVKKYYDAAHEYLEKHLIHESMAARKVTYTAANGKDMLGRYKVTKMGALAGGGNPPQFMLRNPVTTYAQEGDYELTLHWYCFYGPPTKPDQHQRVKPLRTPTVLFFDRNGGTVLNPVKEGKKNQPDQCATDKPIRIRLDKRTKFLSFRGPDSQFRAFDKTDPRYVKLANSDLPKNEKRAALKKLGKELMKELHGDKEMFLLVTGATFRGPLDKPETAFNKTLFGKIARDDDIGDCAPILEKSIEKLFRRPVPKDVLDKYLAIAKAEHAQSGNCYQAVKVALNAAMCSPYFLFEHKGDRKKLDDYAIASRLSYFLWNSVPDDELLSLAARGKLADPTVRREQALRLLADRPKSDRFVRNFTHQWLGLHKFGAYSPNPAYIRTVEFTKLKPSLEQEPAKLVAELLYHNLSARNFVDSEFVVWDKALESHYSRGSSKPKLDRLPRDANRAEFRRRTLVENPERARGGLLGMASILSLTTDGENTKPVLRGVWIARRMLGVRIEAPASVPAVEINLGNVSKPREVLAKHKQDPSCYACHVKFDHFGLAMENYDVLGRWTTQYAHPVLEGRNKFVLAKKGTIDSRAETPDGKPMAGVAGVKDYLLANEDRVMRHLLETMFGYALGREVRYKDRERIAKLVKSMKANDYKLRDIILALVASDSFAER